MRGDPKTSLIIGNDHWLSQETRLDRFSDNLRGKGVECEVERNSPRPPPNVAGEVFCCRYPCEGFKDTSSECNHSLRKG